MSAHGLPHGASQIVGMNFNIPNWSYDLSPAAAASLIPGSFNHPSSLQPQEVLPEQNSPQLSSELTVLSLKAPSCPQCQGQKYDFTAYFHSLKFFPSPPHSLRLFVEKAYILKNKLQSLLITYCMRAVEAENLPNIESEIQSWVMQVGELAKDVLERDHSMWQLVEQAQTWTMEMARMLWDHVRGADRLVNEGMGKRRMRELVSGFRKVWEEVWVALSQDSGMAY